MSKWLSILSRSNWGLSLTGLGLFGLLLISALFGWNNLSNYRIIQEEPTEIFTVYPGDSASIISARLASEGKILHADLMSIYVKLAGFEKSIQEGEYLLDAEITLAELVEKMVEGDKYQHRITFFLLLYLCWMLITCVTSSMPLVSFKMWVSRCWYIFPIFFIGSMLFQDRKNIYYFITSYIIPLSIVVIYTIVRHAGYSFDKESAHYMMSPFFNDHTSYGAMIAFYIPLVIALFWIKRDNFLLKPIVLGIVLILILGLILCFTRAAWISLFISCIIAIIIQLKVNRLALFASPFILVLFLFLFQNSIVSILESNRQDSSDNLMEHVSSISNISTDASNMERINRWKCALKMFSEKPVFGWGPGTYQFQYASFQLSSDRTIISSNSGDMGNAHSEYLGPLCESGFLGFFTFFILVMITIIRAINMYYKSNDEIVNAWLLAIIIALTSYFIHGLFNNFLDTDKASIAVWGVIAILVALDVQNHKKQSDSLSVS